MTRTLCEFGNHTLCLGCTCDCHTEEPCSTR